MGFARRLRQWRNPSLQLTIVLCVAACLIGALAPSLGSVRLARAAPASSGTVTAGINAQPSMRTWRYNGPNPDGWWCAPPNCYQNANPQVTIDTELSLASQLGVKVLREEFPWALIEPGQGSFDWSRSDLIVGEAAKYGVPLQPVLVFTPKWANAGGPTYPPSPTAFQAFAQAIAARYTGIHYWEMWNEPNYGANGVGYWWPGSEQDYVHDVLCPGYTGVKAANPAASVLLGGPSSPDLGWLGNIYGDGGGSCFDIMAIHDYGSPENDAPGVYNLLVAHGQASKPIWVGEFGTQEQGTSDPNQTSLLNAVYASNAHIAVAEWYNLRDDFSMTCCPMAVHSAAHWGLVQHDDATVKSPGFATYQQLASGSSPPPSAPVVSGLAPTSGPVGTSVTVSGSAFTGATTVTFNGTAAGFRVASDTSLTATVPAGATSGPIAVTTPAGTGRSTASFMVTGSPPPPPPPSPVISGFSPTMGAVGTSVSISGSHFTGTSAVRFNGTAAMFIVVSDSSVTADVPAATSGPISVTTPGGTATSSASFTVTAPPPPTTCPSGWTCQDIGSPALAGGQSVTSTGMWSASGSGTGIGGTADQAHFISMAMSGDGTVSADVSSLTNAGEHAQAGVMVRTGTDSGAPEYSVALTGHGVIEAHYRVAAGASTVRLVMARGIQPPIYLRVVRSGTTYSAATSSDGVTWKVLAGSSVSIAALAGTLLAGVVVTSGNPTAITTAGVDHAAVVGAGGPAASGS